MSPKQAQVIIARVADIGVICTHNKVGSQSYVASIWLNDGIYYRTECKLCEKSNWRGREINAPGTAKK